MSEFLDLAQKVLKIEYNKNGAICCSMQDGGNALCNYYRDVLGISCSQSSCSACCIYAMQQEIGILKKNIKNECYHHRIQNTLSAYITSCCGKLIYNTNYIYCPYCGGKIRYECNSKQ